MLMFSLPNPNEFECKVTHNATRFTTNPYGDFVFTASVRKSSGTTKFRGYVRHRNAFLLLDGEREKIWSESITAPDVIKQRLKELHAGYLEHYENAKKRYAERVALLKEHFAKAICTTQDAHDLSTYFSIHVEGVGEFKGEHHPIQPPQVKMGFQSIGFQTPFNEAASTQFSIPGVGTFEMTFTPLPEAQQHDARLSWARTGGGSSKVSVPDTVKNDGLANGSIGSGGSAERVQEELLNIAAHKVARTDWQIPALDKV